MKSFKEYYTEAEEQNYQVIEESVGEALKTWTSPEGREALSMIRLYMQQVKQAAGNINVRDTMKEIGKDLLLTLKGEKLSQEEKQKRLENIQKILEKRFGKLEQLAVDINTQDAMKQIGKEMAAANQKMEKIEQLKNKPIDSIKDFKKELRNI